MEEEIEQKNENELNETMSARCPFRDAMNAENGSSSNSNSDDDEEKQSSSCNGGGCSKKKKGGGGCSGGSCSSSSSSDSDSNSDSDSDSDSKNQDDPTADKKLNVQKSIHSISRNTKRLLMPNTPKRQPF